MTGTRKVLDRLTDNLLLALPETAPQADGGNRPPPISAERLDILSRVVGAHLRLEAELLKLERQDAAEAAERELERQTAPEAGSAV